MFHYVDRLLYTFIFLAVIINGIYILIEENWDFMKYSFFWLYNGMAVWCFDQLRWKTGFERYLKAGVKINILIQTGIWISGNGALFYEPWGGTRYMGTFHDPNQLAFFIFTMILLLYLTTNHLVKEAGIYYLFAVILIWASKSTGVFLGVFLFVVSAGIQRGFKYHFYPRLPILIKGMLWLGLFTLFLFLWQMFVHVNKFSLGSEGFTLIQRIQEKLWKIKQDGLIGLCYDRGWEKLFLYPKYLIYGAGEGGFSRFSLAGQINEIHSCLFSILFCYGIVPSCLALLWLRQQLKQMPIWMWPAILGLLVESFFLINYRQPLFWLVLVYGRISCTKIKKRINNSGS